MKWGERVDVSTDVRSSPEVLAGSDTILRAAPADILAESYLPVLDKTFMKAYEIVASYVDEQSICSDSPMIRAALLR